METMTVIDAMKESLRSKLDYWIGIANSLREEKWRLDKRIAELESEVLELKKQLSENK